MKRFKWAVIGAGAAGIASVGRLLDANVSGKDILWIDPDFQGGDLARCWRQVSSNTTVSRFLSYFEPFQAFEWQQLSASLELSKLPLDKTCLLTHPADALQAVSKRLETKTTAYRDWVTSLSPDENHHWQIKCQNDTFESEQVILAQGSLPNTLDIASETKVLPFQQAIDINQLKLKFDKHATYAVFGASHSAIIILANLHALGAKKIIHFYRHPCRYAVDMGDWILYDDTGLKGAAADWARQYIDGDGKPANLQRILSTDENIERFLPQCDQIIYATGFHRRDDINIEGYDINDYNPHTGLMAPHLYGVGIAYPEKYITRNGDIEYRVGLSKFADYLHAMSNFSS